MEKDDNKELLEKVEQVEKQLKDVQDENTKLKTENSELRGKIASVKVDGLVKEVAEPQTPKEEEITFDFDF